MFLGFVTEAPMELLAVSPPPIHMPLGDNKACASGTGAAPPAVLLRRLGVLFADNVPAGAACCTAAELLVLCEDFRGAGRADKPVCMLCKLWGAEGCTLLHSAAAA